MKKALYIIGIALAIAGCTKSEIIENTPSSGEISFSAGVATRVGSGDDDCTWASSDKIGINTSDGEKNLQFAISNTTTGAMTNESGTTLMPLASGDRTYYAYHPYSEAQDETSTITIDFTADYPTPLLWATATSNDKDVTLQFTHQLPKVTFNLTAGDVDVTTLDGAMVWIEGANYFGEFNLTTGTFDETSYKSDKDITLTLDANYSVTAYLLPSTNVKLWINTDGNTFVKSISDTWVSGSSYVYNITVGETAAKD